MDSQIETDVWNSGSPQRRARETIFYSRTTICLVLTPPAKSDKHIRAKTAGLMAIDAARLAKEAGNPLSVNMVLLGALVGGGKVPIQTETVKKAIRSKTKQAFVESNLKAFELGLSAARNEQS